MEYQFEIEKLIDSLGEARTISGAIFEGYANKREYDKAVVFQILRDTIREYEIAVRGIVKMHEKEG